MTVKIHWVVILVLVAVWLWAIEAAPVGKAIKPKLRVVLVGIRKFGDDLVMRYDEHWADGVEAHE